MQTSTLFPRQVLGPICKAEIGESLLSREELQRGKTRYKESEYMRAGAQASRSNQSAADWCGRRVGQQSSLSSLRM